VLYENGTPPRQQQRHWLFSNTPQTSGGKNILSNMHSNYTEKIRMSSSYPLSTLLWQPTHTHRKPWEQQKDFKFHKILPHNFKFPPSHVTEESVLRCVSVACWEIPPVICPKVPLASGLQRQVSAGLPASAGANIFPLPNKWINKYLII
jgi:hypothetical protein